jgi:hypothetical protein
MDVASAEWVPMYGVFAILFPFKNLTAAISTRFQQKLLPRGDLILYSLRS